MIVKTDLYIPPDFERAFAAHVILNKAKEANPALLAEPILAVAGPAGSGKTSTTKVLAEAMGCKLYEVHGKDLVSQMEGQATLLLAEALIEAGRDTDSFLPLVRIDDADLGGLGVDPNMTGTVNSEALKGFVMGWADNPRQITIEKDERPPRVERLHRTPAMVITTNRLDHLHPPILREGRSTVVTLDPHGDELKAVLGGVFPRLTTRQVGQLMKRFEGQSIAFFVSLKTEVAKQAAVTFAEKRGGDLEGLDWQVVSNDLLNLAEGASYGSLVAAGKKTAAQARDANFIPAKPQAEEFSFNGKHGFRNYGNGAVLPESGPQPHPPAMKS